MKNKTIALSRLTHHNQRSENSLQESPEVKRIKTITSEAKTDFFLSPFDLISWKQKTNYITSEKIRKLKIQNDTAFYLVSREKVRTMPKAPTRKARSQLSHCSFEQNISRKQINISDFNSKFLTTSQESLLDQHNTPSIRTAFKQKHKQLYQKLINRAKSKEKKTIFVNRTEQVRNQIRKQSKQKQQKMKYFKSKYQEVNKKMERIIKNWQKNKKSINQRYYELWAKPKTKKISLKKLQLNQQKELSIQPI